MARLDMALRIEHPGTASTAPGRRRRGFGWYATFVLLALIAFVTIYYFTGRDALGATARFLWNGVVLAGEALINLLSGLLGLLARGMGWRRLSRLLRRHRRCRAWLRGQRRDERPRVAPGTRLARQTGRYRRGRWPLLERLIHLHQGAGRSSFSSPARSICTPC
jgi:hypothetical protein